MKLNKNLLRLAIAASVPLFLAACNGDDDNNSDSDNSASPDQGSAEVFFQRVASFPICSQIDATCNTDEETVAEIVAASSDGQTLIYTDSEQEKAGFVDISNATNPTAAGTVDLAGEPTSVAVKGDFALVGVNTSADFINVAGHLDVIDIASQTITRSIDLGGQPDSVAISPDGNFIVIAIENERDEDLGDGAPPQAPAGTVVIVDSSDSDPANWTTSNVDLTGLADLYAGDPEPEYVDINADNIAVVTLQENNHIVLIDLVSGTVSAEFSAGDVDLTNIDATEEDPAIIDQTESLDNVLREPDGVSWIGTDYFATADEGDLDGGSRGFTVFDTSGTVVYNSGADLDHMAVRFGHYPDGRSGNKGNEPENVEYGVFGEESFLFVNSERSNLVFVYDVADPTAPVFKQVLPAGIGPEGGLAIPSRDLLVVASEKDDRGDKFRSVLNIYSYDAEASSYPTLQSVDRESTGTPIPWSAMSGLSYDPDSINLLYAVEDSFYGSNRIFTIDTSTTPASLAAEITLMDSNDVFASIATSGAVEDPNSFDDVDLAAMINADKTVNIDGEGIAKSVDGGFWIASEGAGTFDDDNRDIEKLNFIFKTDANGVIEDVVTLPDEINAVQLRFGFEGITEFNGSVYVAFQRAWNDEDNARIGIYDTASETWSFVFYPLDTPESQDGGWVGLSDITALGDDQFLVLERDNKGGTDAAIKRIYSIDLSAASDGDVIEKTLVRDLMESGDLTAPGGLPYEKLEGMARLSNGDVYIINDNDGVDDNSGETQLINLGDILN